MEDGFRRFQNALITVLAGASEFMRNVVNFLAQPTMWGMILIVIAVILVIQFGQFLFGLAIGAGLIWLGWRMGRRES